MPSCGRRDTPLLHPYPVGMVCCDHQKSIGPVSAPARHLTHADIPQIGASTGTLRACTRTQHAASLPSQPQTLDGDQYGSCRMDASLTVGRLLAKLGVTGLILAEWSETAETHRFRDSFTDHAELRATRHPTFAHVSSRHGPWRPPKVDWAGLCARKAPHARQMTPKLGPRKAL
jgi:hypothetical protein